MVSQKYLKKLNKFYKSKNKKFIEDDFNPDFFERQRISVSTGNGVNLEGKINKIEKSVHPYKTHPKNSDSYDYLLKSDNFSIKIHPHGYFMYGLSENELPVISRGYGGDYIQIEVLP